MHFAYNIIINHSIITIFVIIFHASTISSFPFPSLSSLSSSSRLSSPSPSFSHSYLSTLKDYNNSLSIMSSSSDDGNQNTTTSIDQQQLYNNSTRIIDIVALIFCHINLISCFLVVRKFELIPINLSIYLSIYIIYS